VTGKPLPRPLTFLREYSPIKWGSEGLLAAEFAGKHVKGAMSAMAVQTDGSTVGKLGKARLVLSVILTVLKEGIAGLFRKKSDPTAVGDHILKALAIPHASIRGSVLALIQLVGIHSALALIGLVGNKPRYQKSKVL